jgi:hypothetical protein
MLAKRIPIYKREQKSTLFPPVQDKEHQLWKRTPVAITGGGVVNRHKRFGW